MAFEGYREYRSREFCRDVKCPVQQQMEGLEKGSPGYEKVHEECKKACRHSTREFHYWLIGKGFLIVKKEGNE